MQLFRTKSVEQTIAETGEEGRKLKRNLTWWDLSIMGVAVAVGAGIFSVGAQAAAFHAGPAVIISFLIAGIVCGAAVMCYAEFASMIPVAGSAYTFTYTTVGEIMAWIIGWDLILEMLMAGSVISKYWGVYLNDFMRLMGWNANTNLTFGSFHIDIAPIIIVAFFTTLLVFGTKIGARVDGAMTVLKIAIVFFVVIVGFFYVKASNFTPFIPPSQPASTVEGSSAVTGVLRLPIQNTSTTAHSTASTAAAAVRMRFFRKAVRMPFSGASGWGSGCTGTGCSICSSSARQASHSRKCSSTSAVLAGLAMCSAYSGSRSRMTSQSSFIVFSSFSGCFTPITHKRRKRYRVFDFFSVRQTGSYLFPNGNAIKFPNNAITAYPTT